jgi:hypothetical protein
MGDTYAMKARFKKFGLPLILLIGGSAILGTIWWANGAEGDDVWFYLIADFFVLYAAYELFSGISKRGDK